MKYWNDIIIVTGGAGFIGSCVVRTLNDMGIENIVIVDNVASTEKWMNMRNKKYIEYISRDIFLEKLGARKWGKISGIIHMGACSSTTESNFDYLWTNNVEFTKTLWKYCTEEQIPLIYASSAATYGDGINGFDDGCDIDVLRPLNGYGYSKQVFDQWTLKQENKPGQCVGLKFFNVYGPNEYFKGSMASMAYHGYKQLRADGKIKLFKSCNPNYADGGQLRDFVYVKDICKVIKFFIEHPEHSGLFNVGTGRAQSFYELVSAVFESLGLEPNIEYIDMPIHLREKYQYYTKAEMKKIYDLGYKDNFMSVQEGVRDYVLGYLDKNYEIY